MELPIAECDHFRTTARIILHYMEHFFIRHSGEDWLNFIRHFGKKVASGEVAID